MRNDHPFCLTKYCSLREFLIDPAVMRRIANPSEAAQLLFAACVDLLEPQDDESSDTQLVLNNPLSLVRVPAPIADGGIIRLGSRRYVLSSTGLSMSNENSCQLSGCTP